MAGPLPVGEPVPTSGDLPESAGIGVDERAFGAYVHVPFCRVRCGYCDFNTYTATELRGAKQSDYAGEVEREIALSAAVLEKIGAHSRALRTVFFGGGTPTLLPPADLARMLATLRTTFGIESGSEISIEANPDSVDHRSLVALREAGFTRVSFGMQSAVPSVLHTLDRTHDPKRVPEVVAAARDAGLDVSIDLIYGTPGETLDDWARSLDAALALGTRHVSAYSLIVEEGTAMHRKIARGELPPVDDDLAADMYLLADERFREAGLAWYEVSNWASDETHRSRHNLAYWQGGDWWGYGPGSHSHVGGTRWWNVKHPAAYAQRLAEGVSPAHSREVLDDETRHVERVLLETRTVDGLDTEALDSAARERVASLIARGLVDARAALAGRIRLTLDGRLLADAVVRELLP